MISRPKPMNFSTKPKDSRKSTRSHSHYKPTLQPLPSSPALTHKPQTPPRLPQQLSSTPPNHLLSSRISSSKYSSLSTTCWCLFDERTNTELGFRQNYQREIASLTKIMTAVVGLELKKRFCLSPTTLIRVTETATKNIGTTAGLKFKNWVYLKDLFYGILLPSGNDAAHLLAEFMGFVLARAKREDFSGEELGSVDLTQESTTGYVIEFVRQMNGKADELGLALTRFSNPHGLQNAMNISTARDIMVLSRHASRMHLFREVMNTQMHRYCQFVDQVKSRKEVKVWENTNVLLREGWEGIKTGQTVAAGNCLSSLKGGVFIVVLNCPDSLKRFTETKRLFTWYSQKGHQLKSTLNSSTESFEF